MQIRVEENGLSVVIKREHAVSESSDERVDSTLVPPFDSLHKRLQKASTTAAGAVRCR